MPNLDRMPSTPTRTRRLRPVALAVAALVTFPTACGDDDRAEAGSARATSTTAHAEHGSAGEPVGEPVDHLDVVAGEFTFDVNAERIRAGAVTISLRNEGALPHQVSLVRLPDGVDLDEFVADLQEDEAAALAGADLGAGVNPVERGGEAAVRADLEPGTYALLCFVPGPDGGNHVDQGMVHQIEVVEAGGADVAAPAGAEEDVVAEVVLDDFSITPPATGFTEPGTYRFVNRGEEAHEVVFVRLKDGRTLADAATYQLGGPGEAPFTFEAGPAGMAPGSEVYVDLDLRPGSWIALCMIPGEHTGQPHADMGMLLPFEVPA